MSAPAPRELLARADSEPRRRRVRVHAMTIGLHPGDEPSEWFASCTDADWSQGGASCNWYGAYRPSRAEAKSDAARHRRSH